MITRPFEPEDVDEVVALGILMHEESNYKGFKLDPFTCKVLFYDICDKPDEYFGFLCKHDEKIIGFMAGYISEFYFGPQKIAVDFGLFVRQDRRGCMAGVNLIKKYEEWARKNGADEIQLGLTTGVSEQRTSELYEKLGYRTSGLVFKKEA